MSATLWKRITDVTITRFLRLGLGSTVLGQPNIIVQTDTNGGIFSRGTIFRKQSAPATATSTATLTTAQMLAGILVSTPGGNAAYTMPTGTALKAALPATLTADDSFTFTIINVGTTTQDVTLTASTDITIVGEAVLRPGADAATEQGGQGIWLIRFVTGVTFIAYRIS